MKIRFMTYLAAISILGYLGIIVNVSTGLDVYAWVDALLFMIIGVALSISGGIQLLFEYFKNGLTFEEINKIVTVIIGIASFIVGLLSMPIINITFNVVGGVKIIIAVIAIFFIALETLGGGK